MGSLNPDLVEVFLQNYHTFNESGNLDYRLFLLDINTAMYNAPLTSVERQIINRLFVDPSTPPQRDKADKNGNYRGRPSGGTTQTALCAELGIEKSTFSNLKRSAITKMAAFLGDAYDV